MPTFEKALLLAVKAHDKQYRRNGDPYITHPIRVTGRVTANPRVLRTFSRGALEELRAVAILHDVVEDTAVTLEDLRAAEFSEDVVEAVDALTRRPGETYADFIERISKNRYATAVKLADLEDNLSDLEPDHGLRKRYEKAQLRLLCAKGSLLVEPE